MEKSETAAARLKAQSQRMGKLVHRKLIQLSGQSCGFILLAFINGEAVYIGTDTDRARVAMAMREFADKWEAEAAPNKVH